MKKVEDSYKNNILYQIEDIDVILTDATRKKGDITFLGKFKCPIQTVRGLVDFIIGRRYREIHDGVIGHGWFEEEGIKYRCVYDDIENDSLYTVKTTFEKKWRLYDYSGSRRSGIIIDSDKTFEIFGTATSRGETLTIGHNFRDLWDEVANYKYNSEFVITKDNKLKMTVEGDEIPYLKTLSENN